MIIFVPEGSDKDKTRSTKFYDGIFEYLQNCGIHSLDYSTSKIQKETFAKN